MTKRRRVIVLASAALLLVLALGSPAQQGQRASVSAVCRAGCNPAPTSFVVPRGAIAKGFAVESLAAGVPCSGVPDRVKGFSIRSGGQTALVFYLRPTGPVSDPVPLEDLELSPGAYELYAAPAAGASVTLSYKLVEQ